MGLKTALSLLIAVFVFAGITVVSSLGLFSSIENSFYAPAQRKIFQSKLSKITNAGSTYFDSLLTAISNNRTGFLSQNEISAFFEQTPSDKILQELGTLIEDNKGIEGIRIVDSYGKRIHFSTFRDDYKLNAKRRIYSNYQDLKTPLGNNEIDFQNIKSDSEQQLQEKTLFDEKNQRIILAFPYKTKENSAFIIFYINLHDFITKLANENVIGLNENIYIVSSQDNSSGALIFGLEEKTTLTLSEQIISQWKNWNNLNSPINEINFTNEKKEEINLELLFEKTENNFNFAYIFDKSLITLPFYVRILLLICAFVSVCLIILILFSIKKDDDIIIRDRIKRVQLEFLSEYFDKNLQRSQIAGIVLEKKDAISKRIKQSFGKKGKKHSILIDEMLNQSWTEIISLLCVEKNISPTSSIDITEIKKMLEDVISKGNFILPSNVANQVNSNYEQTTSKNHQFIDDIELTNPTSELEELEELEQAEELNQAENAENSEKTKELEQAEELNQAEITENSEKTEQIDDTNEVEELEELEQITDAEPIDDENIEEPLEIEELEEITDAEPIDDENVEEPLEIEEPEEITDAEPIDNENIEEPLEIEELEQTEQTEEIEELEQIDDAEPIDDAEEFDTEKFIKEINTQTADEIKLNSDLQKAANLYEPLIFSDITVRNDKNADMTFIKNISISDPQTDIFASYFEEEKTEQTSAQKKFSLLEKCEILEKTEELVPIETQFTMSSFGTYCPIPQKLSTNVIIQDDDGIFHIAEDSNASLEQPLNEEFKSLVDSVLKN